MTSALQTYIDLHRHAAVRADLTRHPGIALRLLVATCIVGSPLVRLTPEPQHVKDVASRESVETSQGETVFDERRRAVLALLGFDPAEATVIGGNGDGFRLVRVFARLCELPDAALLDVVAVVIGECLAAGSAGVEIAARAIHTDMAQWWRADAAFLDLVRDKEVLVGMVGEVAGSSVAEANATEKGKTLKTIIADHLSGSNGRAKVEGWVPNWMALPPDCYTVRGGVATVRQADMVTSALLPDQNGIGLSPVDTQFAALGGAPDERQCRTGEAVGGVAPVREPGADPADHAGSNSDRGAANDAGAIDTERHAA